MQLSFPARAPAITVTSPNASEDRRPRSYWSSRAAIRPPARRQPNSRPGVLGESQAPGESRSRVPASQVLLTACTFTAASSLAPKACDAIRSGALPARAANRTFGEPGNGATCGVCRRAGDAQPDRARGRVQSARRDARARSLPPTHQVLRCLGARAQEKRRRLAA